MVPIHVVGVGLDGAAGLRAAVRQRVEDATLLVGSSRHLSYFSTSRGDRWILKDIAETLEQVRAYAQTAPASALIVILTSGDPLFFGLGRLLLTTFPPEQLTFHPDISSVQLAFSRVKLSWQDARVISVHGRSLDELISLMQQGVEKIAVLTDGVNTPAAIARLLKSLALPTCYEMWICENLGGAEEQMTHVPHLANFPERSFAALNVVVLQAKTISDLNIQTLPRLGIADSCFLSFPDRPGLITKREVRVQILAELALQPRQIIWDVGAGTGSVAIEIARLCPSSTVYAVEKTAIGSQLIQQNCERFQVRNVVAVQGSAPEALATLPAPDRIFIGGSGGNLREILDACVAALNREGQLVLALATLEHLATAIAGFSNYPDWTYHALQVQLARSVPIANLTRFAPLNPVTLITGTRCFGSSFSQSSE